MRRYTIESLDFLNPHANWMPESKCFTLKGAREAWNVRAHGPMDGLLIIRIYDNWRKTPVEL